MDAQQVAYCHDFFYEILPELASLNRGNQKTLFVLREELLMVEGPDGKPMSVAARTVVGAQGEIEFHRDDVKMMSPEKILFLMAHEFQNKVLYKGNYITDNQSMGPFRNGRELLDAVAAAITDVAKFQKHPFANCPRF